MGCSSCGGSSKRQIQNVAPKTSGAWTLTLEDGTVVFADTQIEAKSLNYRRHGGKGTVAKAS